MADSPESGSPGATLPDAAAAPTADSIQVAAVSDRPADHDVLGFKPYVDAVARFLLSENTRPPLTISIEGPWGSGKSSFMQQLEVALGASAAPQRRPLVVKFNAWRHDKDEALWAAFATTFTDQLAEQLSSWDRTMGPMGLMWGQFMGAGLIRSAASLVLVALLGIVGVGPFERRKSPSRRSGKCSAGRTTWPRRSPGWAPRPECWRSY